MRAPLWIPMTLSLKPRLDDEQVAWRTQAHIAVALALLLLAGPAVAQAPSPQAPVTLRALLDSIRVNHPLLDAARARVRAARGARTTAGTLGNPALAYVVDNTPFPGGRPISGLDREAMTTLTLPLEPLLQRGARVARASADVRAAEADATVASQRLALDASRAYYRVALGQVAVATATDLSAWLDTVVVYNRSRVKEGVTSEADLIRSGLERDRAAADAAMAEAELAQARAELAGYLGVQGSTRTLLVAAADEPLTLPTVPSSSGNDRITAETPVESMSSTASFTRAALTTRGEVRAARERLAAATAGVTLEQRLLIRQLGATIGTKQMAGSTSMIAGLSLPIPLFDANRGEVQRASAEQDAASFELANQVRVTSSEVIGAVEAARVLTERATMLTQGGAGSYLMRASEARRIALGAYREGAVPLFQVIDAARTWGEARLTYYRTLYAQHLSILALMAAEGDDLLAPSTLTSVKGRAR